MNRIGPPARAAFVAALVLLAPIVGACSSDGGDDATPPSASGEVSATDSPAGTPADEPGGAAITDGDPATGVAIPDDVPLGAIVRGIEVAMEPESVEVDGTTVHVYIGADGSKAPVGTECMVVTSVLPDGITGVVHRDGEEITC